MAEVAKRAKSVKQTKVEEAIGKEGLFCTVKKRKRGRGYLWNGLLEAIYLASWFRNESNENKTYRLSIIIFFPILA